MAGFQGGVDVSPGMPICKPATLKAALARGQCLMGLDVGDKTLGVAVSDPGLMIATPLILIKRTKFTADATRLLALIEENQAGGLVIGLPVQMNGQEGRQAQSVRSFADNLLALHDMPMAFWDERLSTQAVERLMIGEADLSRGKRKQVVDRAAAAYILQGALDAMGRE